MSNEYMLNYEVHIKKDVSTFKRTEEFPPHPEGMENMRRIRRSVAEYEKTISPIDSPEWLKKTCKNALRTSHGFGICRDSKNDAFYSVDFENKSVRAISEISAKNEIAQLMITESEWYEISTPSKQFKFTISPDFLKTLK